MAPPFVAHGGFTKPRERVSLAYPTLSRLRESAEVMCATNGGATSRSLDNRG